MREFFSHRQTCKTLTAQVLISDLLEIDENLSVR